MGFRFLTIALVLVLFTCPISAAKDAAQEKIPDSIRTVLNQSQPLSVARQGRLPMYVLPISGALAEVDDDLTQQLLRQLAERGIGYSSRWKPDDVAGSIAEGLRIARMQSRLGMSIAIDANACMYSFFDGTPETLHIDSTTGQRYTETSFGGQLGCPFAIEHRIVPMKERMEQFLHAYRDAGIQIDFVFADWEVDGPIEWNDAWANSQRCRVCQQSMPHLNDFGAFQSQIRRLRGRLQREVLGNNVTAHFPQALVGNYGVYPHDGFRYWYDYFERSASDTMPFRQDQRARYRRWYPEFDACGFTFAMPVVYTWYPTYGWYDFADSDYRWFYNMLLVASNAGKHTSDDVPIIPFVHWHTTAPPETPDPSVPQMSAAKYQQLLWHMLLRGHDTFFLWCLSSELGKEVQLVHDVYRQSMPYQGFLQRGKPINFSVPSSPGSVVSGLRLGNQVLALRSEFGDTGAAEEPIKVFLGNGDAIQLTACDAVQIVSVETASHSNHGTIQSYTDSASRTAPLAEQPEQQFPIGFYELPKEQAELKRMADAGVNLVRCAGSADLDRAQAAGMLGWVSLPVHEGATPALQASVEAVRDHPALAVWEGPDEIVWMFTAYSGLAKTAGFTRDDWNRQTRRAVRYSEEKGATIMEKIRAGVKMVRQLDHHDRPFWINEAADSDLKFVREYMNSIDITGCDYYAVRSEGTDLRSVGRLVKRWKIAGRQRPVWMVLQGFSWHTIHPTRTALYPTFHQSRFMAYDSIVHGGQGILYWGSTEIDDPDFRTSLYALTDEISRLNAFLVSATKLEAHAVLANDVFDPPGEGVQVLAKQFGNDYLIIVVNEDEHHHLGVDVRGLNALEGRQLERVYGEERETVRNGGFVTRLQGYEVKLFTTAAGLRSPNSVGRNYR